VLRLGVRRDEEGEGFSGDIKACGKMAEHFSIRLDVDGSAGAGDGAALNGVGGDKFDVARKGMTASEYGKKKSQVADAAASFERDQAEILTVQRGAGSKASEHSAKGAYAYGEKLRGFFRADRTVAVGETRFEERERMADPNSECFSEIENVAEAALEGGIHARHEQRIGSHAGGNSEVSGELDAIGSEAGDSTDWDLHWSGLEKHLDRFCWRTAETQIRSQRVGCAERNDSQSDGGADEALKYFMDGSVTAADKDGVTAAADGITGERRAAAGAVNSEMLDLNACVLQSRHGIANDCLAPVRILSGGWVIHQRDSVKWRSNNSAA